LSLQLWGFASRLSCREITKASAASAFSPTPCRPWWRNHGLIYKFEDDIRLDSATSFAFHLPRSCSETTWPMRACLSPAFPESSPVLNWRSYEVRAGTRIWMASATAPIVSQYADGGFAYVAWRRGLEALAYPRYTRRFWLTTPSSLKMPTVGLFLQMAGIDDARGSFSTGLTSKRHRMQL